MSNIQKVSKRYRKVSSITKYRRKLDRIDVELSMDQKAHIVRERGEWTVYGAPWNDEDKFCDKLNSKLLGGEK